MQGTILKEKWIISGNGISRISLKIKQILFFPQATFEFYLLYIVTIDISAEKLQNKKPIIAIE